MPVFPATVRPPPPHSMASSSDAGSAGASATSSFQVAIRLGEVTGDVVGSVRLPRFGRGRARRARVRS